MRIKTYEVVCQLWVESEAGWGIRPDGYSLHLTCKDCVNYIEEYWQSLPKEVPREYSRPTSRYLVTVNESIYLDIKKSKNGIRKYDQAPNGL